VQKPVFFFNKCFKKGIKFQCSKDGFFVKIKNMKSYILLSFQHNFRFTNVKIEENHEKKKWEIMLLIRFVMLKMVEDDRWNFTTF
jgi:hypothetical protein